MAEEKVRGSSKLAALTKDDLHESIGTAREAYAIKRWILKGIPPIYDHAEALIEVVEKERVGEVVQGLIALQHEGRNVGLKIFPYGIPFVDGILIEAEIDLEIKAAESEAAG
jgi:hypothetical protein